MIWASVPIVWLSLVATSIEAPRIGSTPTGILLLDRRGEVRGLDARDRGRLVVLVFLKVDCPVVELYAPELARLEAEYRPRGVSFVGVVADGPEAGEEVDRLSTDRGLRFSILRDERGRVATQVGATRTPEVVVLDEARAIRYRGRIDDRYAVGSRKASAGSLDLVNALEALLQRKPVERPESKASGCPIDRPREASASAGWTYNRDVAPILERRCVSCHRVGQVGPFPLRDYRQVVSRARAIAEAVEGERMPPWHADPRHGTFANDPRLGELEKRTLLEWEAGPRPEGDPADLAPPSKFPEGWRITEPDVVVSMRRPFAVPAEGVVDYQVFEVDPGFLEDTWVRAAEIRPGNRRVVHHCNVFLRDPEGGRELDMPGELGSYCLAAMTPGSPPMTLPEGMAKKIPKGWRLLFVVHYSPIGTAQSDQTRIGLVLADPSSVRREVATNLLVDPKLRIPPHASSHRVEKSATFDRDILLLAMFPHMHLRGKTFRYEAVYPDGRSEILLDVPRYDFRWQHRYELAEPRRMPAGTTLRCVAHYDNSIGNPENPDPTTEVLAGQQSWEEMFNGYYDVTLADPNPSRPQLGPFGSSPIGLRFGSTLLRLTGMACLIPAWWIWRKSTLRRPTSW